jgi:hypothetical protein
MRGWFYSKMVNYNGDEIQIEEMPQGCIIYHKSKKINAINDNTGSIPLIDTKIIIHSNKDAVALRDSLNKMIELNQ